jgi:ABC-2 type transport system permease protein
LSPFAHLNAVLAEPWDVGGAVDMLAIGALLDLAGCRRYAQRDLNG